MEKYQHVCVHLAVKPDVSAILMMENVAAAFYNSGLGCTLHSLLPSMASFSSRSAHLSLKDPRWGEGFL